MKQKPMKIAFVGTLCAGKTTLLDNLQKKYRGNKRFAFVEEAARKYLSEHGLTSRDIDENVQIAFCDLAIELEKAAHNSGADIIICDRSVLDSAAYSLASDNIEAAKRFVERVKEWLPTYSKFVVMDPRDVVYKADDVRLESPEYRIKVHENFIKILSELKRDYSILSGTVGERVNAFEKILNI